ncbi:MAG: hypothetical protein ABI579_00365 [Candidatus Sumerlaeota bacterium]
MISAAAFLAVTIALYFCFLVAARRDETLARWECFSAALTFLVLFWTILSFMLGFVGMFRLSNLLAGGLLGALIGFLTQRKFLRAHWKLISIADIASALSSLPKWSLAFLAMGASAAFYFLQLGWRSPVCDYDGLSYHLGLAVHMFQDGDFRHYPYESIMTSHFSRGVELLMAISIMLCGKTTLVNCVQWLILPVMVPGVYATARALGCERSQAVVAAMIPLTVPVILYQSAMTYADLFGGGWFVVAMCAVLGAAGRNRIGSMRVLWMFGAAGLALAAKANAGILAGITGVAALIAWGPRAFFGTRKAISTLLAGFLLSANAGLPWMIFNWMQFGSPLYPFGITLAGHDIAKGVRPFADIRTMAEGEFAAQPLLEKVWKSWTAIDLTSWDKIGLGMSGIPGRMLFDYSFGYAGDSKFGGFGALWLLGGLPAMVLMLIAALRIKDRRQRLYIYTGTIAGFVAFFALVAPWWSRFALFLPVFGGIAIALVMAQAKNLGPNVARVLATWFLLLAAFDWGTCVFQNREAERLRRYHESQPDADDTPIHYYYSLDPKNPTYNAVKYVVDHAKAGDVVSFRTPREALFTGYFVDERAAVRLFPLPTYWPDEDTYTERDLARAVDAQNVKLLLVSDKAAPEFTTLIESQGGRIVYTVPGYKVYEFSR